MNRYALISVLGLVWATSAPAEKVFSIPVSARDRILTELDVDVDANGKPAPNKRISVEDEERLQANGRAMRFCWVDQKSRKKECLNDQVSISNLLQELTLAIEKKRTKGLGGRSVALIRKEQIEENPVRRVSRMIREHYWDNLTRRVDETSLENVLTDPKVFSKNAYLYVSELDSEALRYFQAVERKQKVVGGKRLVVVPLPEPSNITPAYVEGMKKGYHGLLALKMMKDTKTGRLRGARYVVPGGRFNEMYGWDSFFECLGLLVDADDQPRFTQLCKEMVDNFAYQIEHFGQILNANRTYYLTRSQPPFLTTMARKTYEKLPKGEEAKAWLRSVLAASIQEYESVWTAKPMMTAIGLSRYFGKGIGVPPEVETGHFDALFSAPAKKKGVSPRAYEALYELGQLHADEIIKLNARFHADRGERASGNDTTNRWDGWTSHYASVDLNSLLYKYEIDIAWMLDRFGSKLSVNGKRQKANRWREKAERRKKKMNQYFWDERKKDGFFDYDVGKKRRSGYLFASNVYPLWAGWATKEQAAIVVSKVLPKLEMAGGIAGSDKVSRGTVSEERPQRQWDYPHGWAPHQILAWEGLRGYGYRSEAHRLIYKWNYMIAKNAMEHNGTIPEKFDVVKRSHDVFAEYGNVGTKFSYMTKEGFGWMNASYQLGLAYLGAENKPLLEKLWKLTPPERVFE